MSAPGAAVLLSCALLAATGAVAQEPHPQIRCQITGPLVISAYSAFLTEVANQRRGWAGTQARNVANLISLYDSLGCPLPPLWDAVECITAKLVEASAAVTTADAEACMRESGMPIR